MTFPLFMVLPLSLTACISTDVGSDDNEGEPDIVSGVFPDSGQNLCYYDFTLDGIYNPAGVVCLEPGSAWGPDGQDGYHVINPMSFVDNGDGTILDGVTGLTWQKCSLGNSGTDCLSGSAETLTWSTAITQCAAQGAGWRLPTVHELARIVDYGRSYSSIDSVAFPNTAPAAYWSATAHAYDSTVAWYVNFAQSTTWSHYKTNAYYVRCVRG